MALGLTRFLGEKLYSGGEITKEDYQDFISKIGNMYLAGEPGVIYSDGKTREGKTSIIGEINARERSVQSDIGQILIEEFRNAVEAEAAVFDRMGDKPAGDNVIKSMFDGAGSRTAPSLSKIEYAEQYSIVGEEYVANAAALVDAIKKERSQSGGKEPSEWLAWLDATSDELNLPLDLPSLGRNRNVDVLKSVEDRLKKDVASVEKGLDSQAQVLADYEASEDVRVAEDLYSNTMKASTLKELANSGLSEESKAKIVALPTKDVANDAESSDPSRRAAFNQQQIQTVFQRDIEERTEERASSTQAFEESDSSILAGVEEAEDAEIAALPQPDVSAEEEAFLGAEILGETPLTQAEMDADRLANADAFAAADASMLPELSEAGGDPSIIPAVDGAPTGGPDGGPSTPEGFNAELDAIGNTFDVASQFGYRFFFFKPGTDEPREDMMISDPVILDRLGLDGPINVLEYIKVKGITNPREIQAAFAETEWYANTNETMQQFDLEWDAAAPSGALNDDFTLRRKEIVKTELDYISSQLEALGLSDEMTESQKLDLAKTAKRTGMSLQDIRQTLSSVETDYLDFASFTGADGAGTGLLGTYETSIKNMASQYMIGINEEALDSYVMGVYQSDNPEQNLLLLREQLAETAKERFPTLGGLIDRGMTPAQYFAPYSSKASSLLERPVDFMGSDEGLFNQIASGMPDNETGSRTMTFTEANELIRGTAEWQTTKNANDEARTIADDVGRMFGFVA